MIGLLEFHLQKKMEGWVCNNSIEMAYLGRNKTIKQDLKILFLINYNCGTILGFYEKNTPQYRGRSIMVYGLLFCISLYNLLEGESQDSQMNRKRFGDPNVVYIFACKKHCILSG